MHELIAPIEAYAAEHGIVQQSEPESAATRELSPAPAAAHSGGGDGENPTVFRLPIFEAAMTVAAGATEYMSDKMERHRQRRSRLGLFAVGAATVGVLVYTWRRQHHPYAGGASRTRSRSQPFRRCAGRNNPHSRP
jgi:hypothetical protein